MSVQNSVEPVPVETPQNETSSVVYLYDYKDLKEADVHFSKGGSSYSLAQRWTTSVPHTDPEAAAKHAVIRALSENRLLEHEIPVLAMVLRLGEPRVDFIVDARVTAKTVTDRIREGSGPEDGVDKIVRPCVHGMHSKEVRS